MPSVSTESFGSDSISVNGQDPRNNNYMLDGGNNNDDVIGQRAGTQARTPIEAIQEFQVITGQYDAQYGRTSGAVVNAVTKSGTNQFRGVAFGFFQNASLTSKDYFAKQQGTAKPDTQYQRWGGTFGGPIVKNKVHFFGSLERFAIDRAQRHQHPVAARAERHQQITEDRVWNTIIRGDHQVNNTNTYSIRWLREQSPQVNQIIGTGASAGRAGGGARGIGRRPDGVGQLEHGAVGHQGQHLPPDLDPRERHLRQQLLQHQRPRHDAVPARRWPTRTTSTSRTTPAQARINDGIQVENTLAWFIPNKKGDHDVKAGLQYSYSQAFNTNQGNLNGTFSFGRNNTPFNAGGALDLSRSPHRARRRAERVLPEGALRLVLRAGQVAPGATTSRSTSASATTTR